MRVSITVASTIVDPKTRAAFTPECLADLKHQIDGKEFRVLYEARYRSVMGATIPGTAVVSGKYLTVDAELAPPWWRQEDLAARLPQLGGGIVGSPLRTEDGQIHMTHRVQLTAVTVLELHASAAPDQSIRAWGPP